MTMRYVSALWRSVIVTALTLAAGAPALGATPNFDLIARQVGGALPPIISDNNSELVARLQNVVPGVALSRFDAAAVQLAVFGQDVKPMQDPGCETLARTGSPKQGECALWTGEENGTGPHIRLIYANNMAEGNVGFRSRGPVVKLTPASLVPVDLPDDKAFEMAVGFLTKSLGLPATDILVPPANATNPNPFVSDQAIGFSERYKPVVVRKIVTLPRGIRLKSPIVVDKEHTLPFIPAPGNATVVLDNGGVIGAQIQDWQFLRVNLSLDPKSAKTRKDLINEIANDLMSEGGGTIEGMSAHLVYASDWRGTFGWLVPAVRIVVAPVAGEKSGEELQALFDKMTPTAGFIRDYPLVSPTTQGGETPTRATP